MLRIQEQYLRQINAEDQLKIDKYKEYIELKRKSNPSSTQIKEHMAKIDKERKEKEALREQILHEQAENRMWVQMAILLKLLKKAD